MVRVAARIPDRRVLRLIRSYLTAGVLNNGLFETSREGTPQGGPLSPLLSNLVLDELDRELERRGHRFVRYADDCNIYVRSEKAGHRVMTQPFSIASSRTAISNRVPARRGPPWTSRICEDRLGGVGMPEKPRDNPMHRLQNWRLTR